MTFLHLWIAMKTCETSFCEFHRPINRSTHWKIRYLFRLDSVVSWMKKSLHIYLEHFRRMQSVEFVLFTKLLNIETWDQLSFCVIIFFNMLHFIFSLNVLNQNFDPLLHSKGGIPKESTSNCLHISCCSSFTKNKAGAVRKKGRIWRLQIGVAQHENLPRQMFNG